MSVQSLPPTSELFTIQQLVERHPRLLTANRIYWATRHRATNGLNAAGAVFESPIDQLLIHEPAFLSWFLGLSSRAKPRRPRRAAVPA